MAIELYPPKAEARGSTPLGCAIFPCRFLREHAWNEPATRVQIPYTSAPRKVEAFLKVLASAPHLGLSTGEWEDER